MTEVVLCVVIVCMVAFMFSTMKVLKALVIRIEYLEHAKHMHTNLTGIFR